MAEIIFTIFLGLVGFFGAYFWISSTLRIKETHFCYFKISKLHLLFTMIMIVVFAKISITQSGLSYKIFYMFLAISHFVNYILITYKTRQCKKFYDHNKPYTKEQAINFIIMGLSIDISHLYKIDDQKIEDIINKLKTEISSIEDIIPKFKKLNSQENILTKNNEKEIIIRLKSLILIQKEKMYD